MPWCARNLQRLVMPPKKKDAKEVTKELIFWSFKPHASLQVEKTVLIGRMGTNLKVGIVGLPNVGKVPRLQSTCSQSKLSNDTSNASLVNLLQRVDQEQSSCCWELPFLYNRPQRGGILTKTFTFLDLVLLKARVAVPDERWDWLVAHHKPASKVESSVFY